MLLPSLGREKKCLCLCFFEYRRRKHSSPLSPSAAWRVSRISGTSTQVKTGFVALMLNTGFRASQFMKWSFRFYQSYFNTGLSTKVRRNWYAQKIDIPKCGHSTLFWWGLFVCLLAFWDRVLLCDSLCRPGWSLAQRDLSAFSSWFLGRVYHHAWLKVLCIQL